MKTILTIAKWEVLRLRSRFGGKSRVVIFPVLLLAIVLSFTIYHQDFNLCKGIYTIGIESGGPIIGDSRFNSITLEPADGQSRLENHSIDLYLAGNTVLMRDDDRSQYAAGALKKYLENLEIKRIAGQYPIDQAFPLRIVISYLDSPEPSAGSVAEASGASSLNPEKAPVVSPQAIQSVPDSAPLVVNETSDSAVPTQAALEQPAQPANSGPSGRAMPTFPGVVPAPAANEQPAQPANPVVTGSAIPIVSGEVPAPAVTVQPSRPTTPGVAAATVIPLPSPDTAPVATVQPAPSLDQNMAVLAPAPSQSAASDPVMSAQSPSAGSNDSIVSNQLEKWQSGGMPEFKAQFTSENEVIVPSLMTPPMPLAQVIIAFLYVIPMFFISVFFTSSFTEEKVNRKLVILLSSPVTRLQVIFGKMLPYYVYSILVIIGVTIFLKGNILLALAIFLPVMLFVFSIYLMVALTYRTFKDQTFFSVLALSVITVYLVVPAMFAGVNDLSYISPLTLAVQMYRGESFTLSQYLIGTLPLYLIFFLAMYIGRRVFNEEYLMGFKPLRVKVMDAIYLSINQQHLNWSILILSLLLIPVVFAFQLVSIVIVSNLPVMAILWLIMLVSIVIEEVAKSAGIYSLIQHQAVRGIKPILILSALSALGFWAGEKLLLLLAANMSSQSDLVSVFLGSGLNGGWIFIVPLILHFISTFMVCLIASHGHKRSYFLGLVCGTAIHAIYNLSILFATGAFR